VPVEKLNRISRINHQGVIAQISSISYQNLSQIIPALYENADTPLVLVLDNITDVRNFGAIARSAECAGVHAILIPSKRRSDDWPRCNENFGRCTSYYACMQNR
jgi:23S rRNA (guanosine2251-2'-O)-methyltransferase